MFNPLMPHLGNDEGLHWNLFSPMWSVDPTGALVPELAVEVPSIANGGLSEDGLKWRVKLRSDVTWHDGAKFGAEDVKFTLELINNPNFRAANRVGHNLVQNIQVVSPTEITWELSRPYTPYMSILAWTFMVPKHAFDHAADPNTAPFNTAPIGTGAFKWGERVPGDHVTLNANEQFYAKGPYVERAIFRYIPDLTVMFAQFQTGSIDYTGYQGITADHYEAAKHLPGKTIVAAPAAAVESITLNLTRPQFQDQQVREALYYGMDKKSIIDLIYYGLPTTSESYLPKECWGFNANLPAHDFNPAKAKQMLDAAGWLPGPDGIRQKNGVRLEFANSTTAGNQVREEAQEVLQQNWRDIGVAMQIKNMPAAVVWGDYFAMSQYDSVMVSWDYMTGADPDATTFFDAASTPAKGGSGWNSMQYDNPEVNKLLRTAATTVDHTKRKQMYQQVQALVRHDLPILPLFQGVKTEGTKSNLIGLMPNVNVSSNLWNLRTWYWDSSSPEPRG